MRISPSIISGSFSAPPSKAASMRAIICASLSAGGSLIRNCSQASDAQDAIRACNSLGVYTHWVEKDLQVMGGGLRAPSGNVNCGESAAALKMLLPIVGLFGKEIVLTGDESLKKRQIGPLEEVMGKIGLKMKTSGFVPVTVSGELEFERLSVHPNVGTQFLSGVLMCMPLQEHESFLEMPRALVAAENLRLTLEIMGKFGISAKASEEMDIVFCPAPQEYVGCEYEVGGDFGAAAYLLGAGAINGKVKAEGLSMEMHAAEKRICEILQQMGTFVIVDEEEGSIAASVGELTGIGIDATDIGPLVPLLAVLGCYAKGTTVIKNVGRLRRREPDRVACIAKNLRLMGGIVEEEENSLTVRQSSLVGAKVDAQGDGKVAMALAVAALGAKGKTELVGSECIGKSYPNFFEDLEKIGAEIEN